MAKKRFYLIKRKDRLLEGKPTYYCRFRDDDGNLEAWRSTGETSKTRAELWALDWIKKGPDKAIPTLREYAKDFYIPGRCSWLKRQKAKGRSISDSWAQAKRGLIENYVFPSFGKMKLSSINRVMIERWLVELSLSNQTRNHLLYALKTILAEAAAEGLISRSPLEHAEPMGKQYRKRDVFTLEELRLLFPSTQQGLISVWGSPKYSALFFLLAATGIREGEARALQWRHVLSDGWLEISRAVKQDGSIGTPKNGEIRVAALPGRACKVLEWWRGLTPYPGKDALVFFGASNDKPINRRTFGDILGRAFHTAGIETKNRYLTAHSFRHTVNTLMKRAVPANTLQGLLGHRSAEMSRRYDHPSIKDFVRTLEPSRKAIESALKW